MWEETYIQSPNYPSRYPRNTDCTWRFMALKGKVIELTMTQFDVDWKHYDCDDYVEIFNINKDDRSLVSLGKFCNKYGPPNTIKSAGSELQINFHSSKTNEYKGFRIDYRSVEPGMIQIDFLGEMLFSEFWLENLNSFIISFMIQNYI